MGFCYAGLLTLTNLGAERPPGVDDGSVRATLHAVADMLPIFVASGQRADNLQMCV